MSPTDSTNLPKNGVLPDPAPSGFSSRRLTPRVVLEAIAASSEDPWSRLLAAAILNAPGRRSDAQRQALRELAAELGISESGLPNPVPFDETAEQVPLATAGPSASPDDIRAKGWSVAVRMLRRWPKSVQRLKKEATNSRE